MLQLVSSLRNARGAIGCSPDTLEFLETLTTHRPDRVSRLADDRGLSDPVYSRLDVALTDIIDAVAEEVTTLIVIEDCHWMDAASAEVLRQLLGKLKRQRALFVLTTRPSEQLLNDSPFADVRRLVLAPLNVESSTLLLRGIAAVRGKQIADSHIEWCVRVAEGNPYFLFELATHWIETGDQHGVPASLSSVLQQRLARLSANALQVLQACCILENDSTLDIVEAVLDLPAHELLNGINELALAGMLGSTSSQTVTSSHNRLESRHDLLSERVLMQLAPQARSYLHRRAAIVLERRIAHTADASTLWACAKHWQLAGDSSQALRLTESCARHLLEAELPSEAAEAFGRAFGYSSTDSERLRILEGQSLAAYQSSDWTKLMALVPKAKALRQRLIPGATRHDELELMHRRAEWQTMTWENILADSLQCLNAEDASVVHRLEAGVMALMLLTMRGDGTLGRQVYERMKLLGAQTAPTRSDLVLQGEMIFNTWWGSIDDAATAATNLVSEQRKHRNTGSLLRSLCNAAITHRVAGNFEQAVRLLNEALLIAETHGIQLFKAQALPMLGHMAIERGNIPEAHQWLKEMGKIPIANPDKVILAEINSIDARLALLDGRYARARDLVLNDLLHLRTDPLPHKRAYWCALRVAADLANYGSAKVEAVAELEREHLLTRANPFQAFAAYTLYVGLRSLGEVDKAEKMLASYLENYRREKWPAPVHLLRALEASSHRDIAKDKIEVAVS
jgi:tetratricopeptide (TPR) repeat protein